MSVGSVTWYRRRRDALIESSRRAALAALETTDAAWNEDLGAALTDCDADAVSRYLSSHPEVHALATEPARRYAEGALNARGQDLHLFGWAIGFPLTLMIIMIQTFGAATVEIGEEHDAAHAEEYRMRVIGLVHMVNHIDSAFGHTVVLVVYRPGSASEAKVRALGAVSQKVEFYPVACCVSLDSATAFFAQSTLPYRQRLVGGDASRATLYALRAVGADGQPDSDGYVSVIDPKGAMIAHWNSLPDSSELRETLH